MGQPPLPGCAFPADWAEVLGRVEAALAAVVANIERRQDEAEAGAESGVSADVAQRLDRLQRRLTEFQACAAAAERGVLDVDAVLGRHAASTRQALEAAAQVGRKLTEWAAGSVS